MDTLKKIMTFASEKEQIRLVAMNGSRVNKNIIPDQYQDFDIVFLVDKIDDFLKQPSWIEPFGSLLIIQIPSEITLIPNETDAFYTRLMQFEEVRIDLTLIEKNRLEEYLMSDSLTQILLDKDGLITQTTIPTDEIHRMKRPSQKDFDNCINEFWWLTMYVSKGLCRDQYIYAFEHLNLVRVELLRMLAWSVAEEYKEAVNVGSHYKFLLSYVNESIRANILESYAVSDIHTGWKSLFYA